MKDGPNIVRIASLVGDRARVPPLIAGPGTAERATGPLAVAASPAPPAPPGTPAEAIRPAEVMYSVHVLLLRVAACGTGNPRFAVTIKERCSCVNECRAMDVSTLPPLTSRASRASWRASERDTGRRGVEPVPD